MAPVRRVDAAAWGGPGVLPGAPPATPGAGHSVMPPRVGHAPSRSRNAVTTPPPTASSPTERPWAPVWPLPPWPGPHSADHSWPSAEACSSVVWPRSAWETSCTTCSRRTGKPTGIRTAWWTAPCTVPRTATTRPGTIWRGRAGAGLGILVYSAGGAVGAFLIAVSALLSAGFMLAVLILWLLPMLPTERQARQQLAETLRVRHHIRPEHGPAGHHHRPG
jgi:hypothetical protein